MSLLRTIVEEDIVVIGLVSRDTIIKFSRPGIKVKTEREDNSFFHLISSSIVPIWYSPRGTWKQPFHFPPFSGSNTSPRRFR